MTVAAVIGLLTALATLVVAVMKYFPAKSPEQSEAQRRESDVAKIHEQDSKFAKDGDTSHLGDL